MKLGLKSKKEEIEKVLQKTKNSNKDWIKGKNFLKIILLYNLILLLIFN